MTPEEIDKYFELCRTRSTGSYEKNDVIHAIVVTGGYYNQMGRLLAKTRSSVKTYVEKDPELVALIDDYHEGTIDDIEQKVHQSAASGDGPNARFVLTTSRKGKERGYSTKAEIAGTIGVDPTLSALLKRVAERGGKLVE